MTKECRARDNRGLGTGRNHRVVLGDDRLHAPAP